MQMARPITGSRAGDVVLALLILATIIALAPRLRVYFSVTMVDVSLERVMSDGTREALATPVEFKQVGDGYWPGDAVVSKLRPKIDAYMSSSTLATTAPAGTKFDWTIRWSEDSLKLDHTEHVIWEGR